MASVECRAHHTPYGNLGKAALEGTGAWTLAMRFNQP